jgi:hypothetical protein
MANNSTAVDSDYASSSILGGDETVSSLSLSSSATTTEIADSYYHQRLQSITFGHWLQYVEREKVLDEEAMLLACDYDHFTLLDRGLSAFKRLIRSVCQWRECLAGTKYHELWIMRETLTRWRRRIEWERQDRQKRKNKGIAGIENLNWIVLIFDENVEVVI